MLRWRSLGCSYRSKASGSQKSKLQVCTTIANSRTKTNPNYRDIIKGLAQHSVNNLSDIHHEFDFLFWMGDLNYRIELPRDEIIEKINQKGTLLLQALRQISNYSQNTYTIHRLGCITQSWSAHQRTSCPELLHRLWGDGAQLPANLQI